MRRIAFLSIALLALNLQAADTNALKLVKTILLPNVTGRIDHFALDAKGQRLFLSALGNDTVEVIDLVAGKHVGTIGNCSTPQGLAYIPAKNQLIVANGGSGTVKILDGISFKLINSFGDMPNADNIRYDPKTDLLSVAYGDGALSVIRVATGEVVTALKFTSHPESFAQEQVGNHIFVNLPDGQKIAVIDRDMQTIVQTWPMGSSHDNFPMALDESNHRLFIGCRQPPRLAIFDTSTGYTVDNVDISDDTDDLFFDATRKQIYVSCGGGFLDVIAQTTPDSYQMRQRIPTVRGARTCLFSPERSEVYLAVPGSMMTGSAEIRVFKCVQ